MSLFTFQDIYLLDSNNSSNLVGESSKFSNYNGNKCISISNIDNDPNGEPKVILGNFSGMLRIIGRFNRLPSPKPSTSTGIGSEEEDNPNNDDDENNKKEEKMVTLNLLAEIQLKDPILQIESGRFVSATDKLHLALLHSNRLSIFEVLKLSGENVEYGSQYRVQMVYEHNLKRHAFNMCIGSFGHTSHSVGQGGGRHFFCIQSLDGVLSFYEQEMFVFSRCVSNILIPGLISYVPSWDSFVLINAFKLQCFKYSSIAISNYQQTTHNNEEEENNKSNNHISDSKVTPDWSFSIGEEPINLQVLYTSGVLDSYIVRIVLTTFKHIFCFSNGGHMIWSKRLDFNISCVHSFLHGSEHECITIVASVSEPNAIYIYNGTTLRWATKVPFKPVYLGRIFFKEIEGGIVGLGSTGALTIGYLGTSPTLFVAPPIQSRDLDYASAEKELMQLRKIIASEEAGNNSDIFAKNEKNVEIKLEFEGKSSKWLDTVGEVTTLVGTVKINCKVKLNDVRVTISMQKPIICSQESTYIGDIIGRHTYTVEFYIESLSFIPSELTGEVYLFYLEDNSSPHFVHKRLKKIPLFIVAKPNNILEKEAECRLTFSTNKPSVNLSSIYNDFEWINQNSSNGITFLLTSGENVTLLASTKLNSDASESRYRVQTNSLAGMYLIFRDFIDRLKFKFSSENKNTDFSVSIVNNAKEFPLLNELFKEIDAHIIRRKREIKINEELEQRSTQLRAVQRRLLLRFRDKNPVPLTQLENLLDGSLEQINDAMVFKEENLIEKARSECRLSGAIHLILEILKIQNENAELDNYQKSISPHIFEFDGEKSGWEEAVLNSLTYLKTQLASSNTSGLSGKFINFDPNKIKKAIKGALEKNRKKSKNEEDNENDDNFPVGSNPRDQQQQQPEKLVGNEIIERMASARASKTAMRRHEPFLAPIIEPTVENEPTTPSPPPPTFLNNHTIEAEVNNENEAVLLENEENRQMSQEYEANILNNEYDSFGFNAKNIIPGIEIENDNTIPEKIRSEPEESNFKKISKLSNNNNNNNNSDNSDIFNRKVEEEEKDESFWL